MPFTQNQEKPIMKKSLYLSALAAVFLFLGCQEQKSVESQPTPAEAQKVAAIGEAAAGKLKQTLVAELTAAMQSGGTGAAIEVCSNKALQLTQSIVDSSENVLAVKRTTFKYRNPQNAPDEWDAQALQVYEAAAQKGEALPPSYIQKIQREGETTFRYYQPLLTAGLCLNCHGDPNMLTQEVSAQLAALYPDDKATGYKEGDFRGLIRVSVALEE